MVVVMAIIGLLAAITFPSVTSGMDSLRLTSACDSVASFVNTALNRAEQRRVPVELSVSTAVGTLWLRSTEAGWVRRLDLPPGIRVIKVHPDPLFEVEGPRRFLFYPGGTPPPIGIELANEKGARRIVRVNPMSGVPEIERPEAQ
jgi:hypothetical protein